MHKDHLVGNLKLQSVEQPALRRTMPVFFKLVGLLKGWPDSG